MRPAPVSTALTAPYLKPPPPSVEGRQPAADRITQKNGIVVEYNFSPGFCLDDLWIALTMQNTFLIFLSVN